MPCQALYATRTRIKKHEVGNPEGSCYICVNKYVILFVTTYIWHYNLVSACCNGTYMPLYDSRLVLLSAAAPFEPPNMQLHAHTGVHLLIIIIMLPIKP
jgi:hypothetical protein